MPHYYVGIAKDSQDNEIPSSQETIHPSQIANDSFEDARIEYLRRIHALNIPAQMKKIEVVKYEESENGQMLRGASKFYDLKSN